MNYVFKRDSITQLMRDQQAHRLRELRASTDPRAKVVQAAYVKAQREARAELRRRIDERLFSDEDTTPLMEMGEAIRKHGLPEIDRSPSPYWKNNADA